MLGPLVIDIQGTSLGLEDRELLLHPLIGGVILFSRNYVEVEQLTSLCEEIKNLRSPSLLVMVDQEGGRVQRFKYGFTKLPALSLLGGVYDLNTSEAINLTRDCAWMMSSELLAAGVDLSLAPVLDINGAESEVIGSRAFHSKSTIVSELSLIYIKTMHQCGMRSVAKHFPGHGSVIADSHKELPLDLRELKQIESNDLIPFVNMIKHGLAAVMMAHVSYPNVDRAPAGYSKIWITDILKSQHKFSGLVMSDDLTMVGAAAYDSYTDRALASFSAGCDTLLICNNRAAVEELLTATGTIFDRFQWKSLELVRGDTIRRNFKTLKSSQKWRDVRTRIGMLGFASEAH
jgi:beta-N-acetylhexosaminidase